MRAGIVVPDDSSKGSQRLHHILREQIEELGADAGGNGLCHLDNDFFDSPTLFLVPNVSNAKRKVVHQFAQHFDLILFR